MEGENFKNHVIVADDDLDSRMAVEMIIEDVLPDAEVIALENGEAAAAKVVEILNDAQNRVILILSDGRMGGPGQNGTDLYRAVREIPGLQDTPFVMISGGVDKADEAFVKGILKTDSSFKFLKKPVGNGSLVQAIFTMTSGTES